MKTNSIGLAVATALLAAANAPGASASTAVRGVVAGSYFTAPTATVVGASSPSYYGGARVCFDLNANGVCDQGEPSTVTNSSGAFALSSLTAAPLVAEIPTSATNGGHAVTQRLVLRAPQELIAESTLNPALPANVAVTPLSTEVVRAMEANLSAYSAEKTVLAGRLGVPVATVLGDPNKVTDGTQKAAIAKEGTLLTNRFGFAAKMVDRGDVSPAALAADPNATGPAIGIREAEQVAMNVEGIPRYDHIFIVMLENKATLSIKNTGFAPKIQGYLAANNQFNNYFATGNPSEPNYTALGGADDWGITDDSQWNCDATGANAPTDLPLPTKDQPGLANSPFAATCTQPSVLVNHNITNQPNLFTAISGAGMSWRTYSESMNPGQDVRTDSIADTAVSVPDHVYAPGSTNGNTTTIGNADLKLTLPAGLYKTKHHPGMAYQTARSSPDFKSSNRTVGGGQWDSVLLSSTKYPIPAGYDLDQLGTDLQSGDIGNLNFVVPDQCDDMHGVGVSGKTSTGASGTASDCGSVPNNYPASSPTSAGTIITRGDNYVDYLVQKIEGSPIWQNPNKRVAIVLMFDEGNATGMLNSCCGWVPGTPASVHAGVNPIKQNSDGTFSPDTSVNNYSEGNHGHGNSIFAVINNQPNAPKGISDSDAYSHFAFVRTLQDMFQLADPKIDGSYMGRSKYTEKFIAANILNLPEYAGSADTHFDAVRPMNHGYVIPTTYTQKQSADVQTAPQVGPDSNQINVWSLK